MLTRSQKKIQNINDAMNGSGGNNDTPDIESGEENDIDEYGNIENLIDYGNEKQKVKPKKLKLKKKGFKSITPLKFPFEKSKSAFELLINILLFL